jgi:hypothetical protein
MCPYTADILATTAVLMHVWLAFMQHASFFQACSNENYLGCGSTPWSWGYAEKLLNLVYRAWLNHVV